jgi:hypothetical protein
VSQHGSFPGRPRGRRARHENDAPQWQGYDATPAEEREFPDLSPVRPREARERDGRAQGDWQAQPPGQQGQPGQGGWQQGGYPGASGYPAGTGYPADGSGYPGDARGYEGGSRGRQGGTAGYPGGVAGYPPAGPGQPGADPFGTGPFTADRSGTGPFTADRSGTGPFTADRSGTGPFTGERTGAGPFAGDRTGTGPFTADRSGAGPFADGRTGSGTGPISAGQAGAPPWSQGYPGDLGQPRHGRADQAQAPRAQQSEEDIPDWAEPDSIEEFSERWRRRGLDSREDRRADRRKRRRLLFAGGGAVVVVIAVAVYFLAGGRSSATPGFGNLITSFLPGELQQVPNACDTVPAATLNEYLNGTRKIAEPPLNTGADTECTWTLDDPPTYRVLEVQLEAYSPSALYGNGSATDAAELNYESFEQGYVKPGPKSGQPVAAVTDLSGLPGGTQTSAFLATQVFNREGATTDVASVLVRYRNVIITVVVDGLDQATGKKTYGPVAMSDLTSAARTVATQVAGKIVGLSRTDDD